MYKGGDGMKTKAMKIAYYLSRGSTLWEACERVGVNTRTAEKQIVTLRRKYAARNTTHLIAKLIRRRVI
jgi:DNA-binding CsgD family transcriptional regulator